MSVPKTKAWGSQRDGSHYKKMQIQPMEYSMSNELNALQHSIVKYVSRYQDKNGVPDLEKAKHCIQMLIDWEEYLQETKASTVVGVMTPEEELLDLEPGDPQLYRR